MMNTQLYLCSAALLLTAAQTKAADKQKERPNILWLTFEDTSSYEFGCYGNAQVHTPIVDGLASKGIQFMNAWSVAPQSSAARSSLIPDVIPAHMVWMFTRYPMILRRISFSHNG